MTNMIIQQMQCWLKRYSLPLLRISMGAVTFGFGVLKYFPGVSPTQDLVLATTHVLTFGIVLGILSLLVMLPGWLFSGPDHAPTLGGKYVLKDFVMLTTTLVIASTVRRKQAGQKRTGQTERDAQAASCAAARGMLQSSGSTVSLELGSCR